jgi:hypothetical protein
MFILSYRVIAITPCEDRLFCVKMLDLDLCLSASVNVRYILHTQPLGLCNIDLVWESLYPSLSLSILVGLSFSNTF